MAVILPYIVTTKRPRTRKAWPDKLSYALSRRAVATLWEAQGFAAGRVWDAPHISTVAEFYAFLDAAFNLPESGGTVGPLPDGTLIEVGLVAGDWYYLAEVAVIADFHITAALADDGDERAQREILDAFNAREAGHAR